MPHQCTNCGRTFADGSKEMLSGCPDCGGTKFQFSPDGFDGETPGTPPDPPDRPGDGMSRAVGDAAATVRDLVSGSVGSDATRAAPPEGAGDPPSPGTGGSGSDEDIIVAESTPDEDAAQADARSEVAGPDDIPGSDGFDPTAEEADDRPRDGAARDRETEPAADPATATPGPNSTSSRTDPVTGDDGKGVDAEDRTGGSDGDTTDGPGCGDRPVATEPDAETADRPDLSELRAELNDQFESIRIVERGQYELNLMELYDRDEVIVALQEDGRYSIRVPEAIGEADV